jgi:hypothetical protein
MFKEQRGFSVVEGLLVVVTIALIGTAVWYVVSQNEEVNETTTPTQTEQAITEAPDIETTDDLDQAQKTLEQTDIESLDTSELDAELENL